MELERTSLASQSERRGDGVNRLGRSHASTGATRHAPASRAFAALLAAELLVVLALGVTGYAVAANEPVNTPDLSFAKSVRSMSLLRDAASQ